MSFLLLFQQADVAGPEDVGSWVPTVAERPRRRLGYGTRIEDASIFVPVPPPPYEEWVIVRGQEASHRLIPPPSLVDVEGFVFSIVPIDPMDTGIIETSQPFRVLLPNGAMFDTSGFLLPPVVTADEWQVQYAGGEPVVGHAASSALLDVTHFALRAVPPKRIRVTAYARRVLRHILGR